MKNTTEKEKHYFSQAGLQNLKSDVDLVFAIGAEIKLLRKGKRFFGHCPMHQSKEPTLVISSKKNLWYCFGSCRKGGSIVDWVMHKDKLRLVEALSFLAEQYPFLAQKGLSGKMGFTSTTLSAGNEGVPEQFDLLQHQPILTQIVEHYHSCLFEQSRAIRYLRSIGINHGAAKKHKIGFCDSSLAQTFIDRVNGGDEVLKKELKELGLLRFIAENQVQERFHGQIVFPVFNAESQCAQLFGRTVPEKIKIAHVSLMVS